LKWWPNRVPDHKLWPQPEKILPGRRYCFQGHLDKIVELDNVRRRWIQPAKSDRNPVLTCAQERIRVARTGLHPNVIYDEQKKMFRMWYCLVRTEPAECSIPLAYAESKDGVSWAKASLVYEDGKLVHGPAVVVDRQEKNPGRRYKLFYNTCDIDRHIHHDATFNVAFSRDGIAWRKYRHDPVYHMMSDTGHCVFRDPGTGRYVAFVRLWLDNRLRAVGRMQSGDFINWTRPRPVIVPGEWNTVGDEFYGFSAFPYEGAYLGLLWVYHRNAPNSGAEQARLMYSTDGLNWTPAGDGLFIPAGKRGSWDAGMIQAGPQPVILKDRIVFYYSGSGGSHGKGSEYNLGLATLRRDGFACLEPFQERGTVTTRPFELADCRVGVNANAGHGSLSAAVLNEDSTPVDAFSHENCRKVSRDSTDCVLRWKGQRKPAWRKKVRLQFALHNAELYSFWIGG